MEDELARCRQQIEELTNLLEVSKIINSTLSLDEVLRVAMESTRKVMKAEASTLFIINKYSGNLVARVALGEKGEEIGEIQVPRGIGIAGWVAEKGEPLLVPDVEKDPRFYKGIDEKTGFKTRSILCVPLKVKEETIGVLEAINKCDGSSFKEEEIEFFNTFANLVAMSIENAKLHDELHRLFINTTRALSATIEARDSYGGGHSERVMRYSLAIVKEMGLSQAEMEEIRLTALLHDIGKIAIDPNILSKPSAHLTEEESARLKRHPEIGAKIIRHINELERVAQGIWHHHESYDGTGYPGQLSGEDIPLSSRIVAVANGFDALMSDPAIRGKLSMRAIIVQIEESAGVQYDPRVCEAFMKAYEGGKMKEEKEEVANF